MSQMKSIWFDTRLNRTNLKQLEDDKLGEDKSVVLQEMEEEKRKMEIEREVEGLIGSQASDMEGAAAAENKHERVKKQDSDSESDFEDGHVLIESSICQTKVLSTDERLDPYKRFWVEMRQKENQKVSLKLYRQESRKILKVL